MNKSGLEYDMIHLARLNIKGCMGCLNCTETNTFVQKDELKDVIDRVIRKTLGSILKARQR